MAELRQAEAVEQVAMMLDVRAAEAEKLEVLRAYWKGKQPHSIIPRGVPNEVRAMSEMSRVNLIGLAVAIPAQALYVSGYRAPNEAEDDPAWLIWQANKMDRAQVAVHRGALAYGTAYTVVLPGDPHAVIRGVSPRYMTTLYGEDPDWPLWALEVVPQPGQAMHFRLYDAEHVYHLSRESSSDQVRFLESRQHPMEVVPVVRFVAVDELDGEDVAGEVEPLMALQDQMDATTFQLLVAQHFQAFRQRWAIGWTGADEETKLKASAARLWTFEDEGVKVGEFGQTDLQGYLSSRESTQQFLATVAQIPPHNLLGKLVNLSAEALAAAESSHQRKLTSRETSFGESWDQTLSAAAWAEGFEAAEGAEIRWRDTEARALAATVDALGKLAQMLGVPPQELWSRVPGVTEGELSRWKAAAEQGDAFGKLAGVLERQAAEVAPDPGAPAVVPPAPAA